MRHSVAATLRGVLLLAIPALVGLMLLREPLVALLYQRDAFTSASTKLVAWALLWYAAGLVGHSVVEVVSRAFYALHDTKTPVFVGIGAMTLNIVFSLFFSWLFARVGWMPHGGLALANSLATAIEMVVLLMLMRKRLGGLEGALLWRVLWQAGLPAVVMAGALGLWLGFGSGFATWQVVAVGVVLGAALYGGQVALLRVPEVRLVWEGVRRRIKK
jgi:putative peptidoglycan lipid II flippase